MSFHPNTYLWGFLIYCGIWAVGIAIALYRQQRRDKKPQKFSSVEEIRQWLESHDYKRR